MIRIIPTTTLKPMLLLLRWVSHLIKPLLFFAWHIGHRAWQLDALLLPLFPSLWSYSQIPTFILQIEHLNFWFFKTRFLVWILNDFRFLVLCFKVCNNHVNKPIRIRNNKKIADSSRKLYSSVPSIISVLELWPFAMLEGNKNTKLDAISATMAEGVRIFLLNWFIW